MREFLNVLMMLLSATVVILCLLQEQPDSGLLFVSNANNLALFSNKKARGGEKVLIIATYAVGIMMMVVAFVATKI